MSLRKPVKKNSRRPVSTKAPLKFGTDRFSRNVVLMVMASLAIIGVIFIYISNAATPQPMHTNIVATTYWVGENFQDTGDGSQVCSAYDSNWAMHWAPNDTEGNQGKLRQPNSGCNGSSIGGCDGVPGGISGGQLKCATEVRTAANNYFPSWASASRMPRENPFYLDLPYDDINEPDGNFTGRATRCNDIPWRNDSGYAGRCTDYNFSYMKNRWVMIKANGKTCYGQIQDAGPADEENGSPHYDDRAYVFGSSDARPLNKSYGKAGMDVSPALNGCLGFSELDGIEKGVSWQFVEAKDVPQGPWTKVITTSQVNGRKMNEANTADKAYLDSIRLVNGTIQPTGQPNVTPVVTGVSSLQNNQTIIIGSSITLSATATDSDGTVTKIDLYDDAKPNTTIGSVKSGASLTYIPTTTGVHKFTAVATDNAGAVSARSSQSVTVTVNPMTPSPVVNQKPTVSLSSSQSGQTVHRPIQIMLTASARDGDGSIARVQIFRDGVSLINQTNPVNGTVTYTDTDAGIGQHTYYAVAYDNQGTASDNSNQIRITVEEATQPIVDTEPPTPITGLTASLSFNWGYRLDYRWNPARDNSGVVSYIVDYTDSNGAKSTNAPSYSFPAQSAKSYTFTVQAVDASGNKTTAATSTVTPKCFFIWCWL